MMYLLQAIAMSAMLFGFLVITGWHGALDARLMLGGLYILIGTVATCGAALLWRLRE
jgi:hypothetical protein